MIKPRESELAVRCPHCNCSFKMLSGTVQEPLGDRTRIWFTGIWEPIPEGVLILHPWPGLSREQLQALCQHEHESDGVCDSCGLYDPSQDSD